MAKNRLSAFTKQSPPSPSSPNTSPFMSNPHPNIEDDNDICPVCDGDCTCNNNSISPHNPTTLLVASTSRSNPSSAPPLSTAIQPLLPSLKIRLTVPQGMRGRRRTPIPSNSKKYKCHQGTTSALGNDGDLFPAPPPPPQSPPLTPAAPPPKRRGRPSKAAVAARQLAARPLSDAHATASLQSRKSSNKQKQKRKKSVATASFLKGKGRSIDFSSDPSGDDDNDSDDDDDLQSGRFPTFVSASGLSSRESSSLSSDDLSDFDDSDSSIKAEEENFILSKMQSRARNWRELLGDDAPKKRDPTNAWVIRPRKKSVGPSDAEMDVDTDATVDEDDEDEDEDGEDDEDEDEDDKLRANGYVGMATGWSEDDEESNFDADLFFASLYDTEVEEEDNNLQQPSCTSGDEGDHSDTESIEASTTSGMPSIPPEFEVTEGWDGQIVFTNGLRDGQGMVDMHFEAHAASLAESSSFPSSDQSDVDMNIDTGDDDEGYEQDIDQDDDGDTTDEELVGDDDLPNERALSLFSLPFCVSAINPMSTMSPAVSPAPRDRRPFRLFPTVDSSPNPADILSGRAIFCDSDDEGPRIGPDPRPSQGSACGPRSGQFEMVKGSRQAIISDLHKDIPSPHPRFRRRKCSTALHDHQSIASQAELALRSPASVCSTSFHDATAMTPPEIASADIVDLNDVLEASFMDPDPSDPQCVSFENESRNKQIKNSNRWDLMTIGAFRQNRTMDGGGGGDWGPPSNSTPGAKTDYGSMMKSSPLSTMLWQNKVAASGETRRRSRKKSVAISPVIFPVHVHDGDRTPTYTPPYNQPPPRHHNRHHHDCPQRSRKELRRERKLQRKSYGPVHHQYQNHQHHSHHHHPNLKTRSTSSLQRMNFSSSVPPLNL